MEFQVPQFIEQKPKIIGPLTLVQFFYLAGGAAISFLAYNLFAFPLWCIIALLAMGAAVALAFVKINGQEMIKTIGSIFSYLAKPKTYTWQRQRAETAIEVSDESIKTLRQKMGIQEKMKSLALKMTVGKISDKKEEGEQKGRRVGEGFEVVTYLTGEQKVAKRVDY